MNASMSVSVKASSLGRPRFIESTAFFRPLAERILAMLGKMVSGSRSIIIKYVCCYLAMITMSCTWAMEARGGGPILSEYYGISPEHLISTYRNAFVGAGFTFAGQKVSRRNTRLYFEFALSEVDDKRGILYVDFHLPASTSEDCMPCAVASGLDLSSVVHAPAEKYWRLRKDSEAAELRVRTEIDERLSSYRTDGAEQKNDQRPRSDGTDPSFSVLPGSSGSSSVQIFSPAH
jgi:hypothetical protein